MIQCQFINYILQSKNQSLLLSNNIGVEFFSDYREEYNYIQSHIREYGCIPDQATFLSKFPEFDVVSVTDSPDYLVDALYDDRNKRMLASTFNRVRSLLLEGKTDEAIQLYSSSSENLVKAKHIDSFDLIANTSRFDDYVERCKDFGKYFIRTGFAELDELIGGWDREEELATIAARPGVGKSWVLLKVAVAALEQGLRVGIYSGEMSERKVGYRFDTLLSHISNYGITKGKIGVQNEYKKYIDSLKDRYKTGCIKVLTPSMISGPAGVTALRAFIEKENLDILCIDQHSLLEDDRKAKTPVEKASNISRDLKNLQVMMKIPIIAVSQQNREGTDQGITSSHIAQSDRISQDSTIILFLEQKDGEMTIHLTKCRDSEAGKKLKYAVDLNTGTFVYMPESENEEDAEKSKALKDSYDNYGCTEGEVDNWI